MSTSPMRTAEEITARLRALLAHIEKATRPAETPFPPWAKHTVPETQTWETAEWVSHGGAGLDFPGAVSPEVAVAHVPTLESLNAEDSRPDVGAGNYAGSRMNEDDFPFGDELPMADVGTELTMAEFRAFWEGLHSATDQHPSQRPALVLMTDNIHQTGKVSLHVDYEPAQLFIDGYHIADYDIDGVEAMRETAMRVLNLHMYIRPEFAQPLKAIASWLLEQADRLSAVRPTSVD